jgi:hypothetical protein
MPRYLTAPYTHSKLSHDLHFFVLTSHDSLKQLCRTGSNSVAIAKQERYRLCQLREMCVSLRGCMHSLCVPLWYVCTIKPAELWYITAARYLVRQQQSTENVLSAYDK